MVSRRQPTRRARQVWPGRRRGRTRHGRRWRRRLWRRRRRMGTRNTRRGRRHRPLARAGLWRCRGLWWPGGEGGGRDRDRRQGPRRQGPRRRCGRGDGARRSPVVTGVARSIVRRRRPALRREAATARAEGVVLAPAWDPHRLGHGCSVRRDEAAELLHLFSGGRHDTQRKRPWSLSMWPIATRLQSLEPLTYKHLTNRQEIVWTADPAHLAWRTDYPSSDAESGLLEITPDNGSAGPDRSHDPKVKRPRPSFAIPSPALGQPAADARARPRARRRPRPGGACRHRRATGHGP